MNDSTHDPPVPDSSSSQNPTPSLGPKPWSRLDRTHLAIWALLAFLPSSIIVFVFQLDGGHTTSVFTVRNELPSKAIFAFFAALATWILSRMEKRSLTDYGIPVPPTLKRFAEGSLWGFAMLSLLLLALRATGHFRVDSIDLSGNSVYRYGLAWAATFLAVSVGEEFSFRGYWLFSVARRLRFWRSAIFTSIIFGVAHLGNHGENILGILQVFGTGLLFCFMIRRTGNLWFAVGYHAAWDWAETFFYGTPDSGLLGVGRFLHSSVQGPTWLTGGSAGPEGSIIANLVLLLCALFIHLRFPEIVYPDQPL